MRHKKTNVRGVEHGCGCGCPKDDAQDGRCNVLYVAECGIRHRDNDGGDKCTAQAVYCTRHGWMWCQEGE